MSDDDDVFAAAAGRKRALAEQLAGRPIEDVVGVVDASGAGGWSEDDGRQTLCMSLHAWRNPGGRVKTSPLTAEITTTPELFDSLWDRINSYDVIRFRGKVVDPSVLGDARAEIVEFLGHDPDPELQQIAVDLQRPVIHRDPQFGDLLLIRSVGWYSTQVRWKGTAWRGVVIELSADADEAGSPDAALDVARALWKDQKSWAKRVQAYAVQELLPIKNESWLDEDEGEAELTPRQFRRRMTLRSITVRPDGSFDFWFDDGDLFLGHSIQIGGSLSEGPTSADIPG